ncbi:uncharacterized protein BDR25DRAFT_379702, partial [Lindgomyces ingoldianus]
SNAPAEFHCASTFSLPCPFDLPAFLALLYYWLSPCRKPLPSSTFLPLMGFRINRLYTRLREVLLATQQLSASSVLTNKSSLTNVLLKSLRSLPLKFVFSPRSDSFSQPCGGIPVGCDQKRHGRTPDFRSTSLM